MLSLFISLYGLHFVLLSKLVYVWVHSGSLGSVNMFHSLSGCLYNIKYSRLNPLHG